VSTVLVVGPDWHSRRTIGAAMHYGGFATDTARSVEQAVGRLRRHDYAAVVVDLGEAHDASALARFRACTPAAIVVVSTSDSRALAIECLDAGADEFIAIPFDPEEMLARLRSVLRRSVAATDEAPVVTDDFVVELAQRRVKRSDGTEVPLTPTEWKLVEVLVRHAEHLMTREELVSMLWGDNGADKSANLRVHMLGIRQKLERDHAHPRYFLTTPALGVRFVSKPVDPTQGAGTDAQVGAVAVSPTGPRA
jgi:two-component system KDP operon response regulator KdpE